MAALFKVITRGEIVVGHTSAEVRRRVAEKTKLGQKALDTLFSGRKAVLKKDQLAAQAQHWINWFGALGLQAYPEMQRDATDVPVTAGSDATPARNAALYHIVFAGEFVEGCDQARAMAKAQRRWGLDAERLELMFSGKRVAIRRGLDEAEARRQLESFTTMGLVVQVDPALPPTRTQGGKASETHTEVSSAGAEPTTQRDAPPGDTPPVPPFPDLATTSLDRKLAAQMARTELNTEAFRNYASEWDKLPVGALAKEKPAAPAAPSLATEPLAVASRVVLPPVVSSPVVPPLVSQPVPQPAPQPFVSRIIPAGVAQQAARAPVATPVAVQRPLRQKSLVQRFLSSHATTLKALRMPFLVVLAIIAFVLVWLR